MESPAPGYWATHEYKRHSVGEIEEFVGWGKLADICKAAESQRDRAFPATLFETGCRVSEGIQLTAGTFDLSDAEWVRCVDVPIVKQKKVGPTRTFSFLKSEPLFSVMEPYLSGLKSTDRLFPFSRQRAYQIVRKLGSKAGLEVWDHWFRSQRASQMGAEYRLSESQLMEWFKVKDPSWARRYCKLGDFGLRGIISEKRPAEWRV